VKIAYYPGCSLESSAREYDLSFRAVCEAVGVELQEVPDWSCCGASSAHQLDPFLSVALPARELLRAEEMGLDLVAPCAACFLRLKEARRRLLGEEALREEVERALRRRFEGRIQVYHPLQLLGRPELKESLLGKVVRPLEGLRVVCYYGCYLVRPPQVTELDDPEDPHVMEGLVGLTGAEILDWSWKVDCCGGAHALLRPEVVERLSGGLCLRAREAGAEGIVTACPLCHSNLEAHQGGYRIPIYYFTELLGLAMGLKGAEGWLRRHLVSPDPKLLVGGKA